MIIHFTQKSHQIKNFTQIWKNKSKHVNQLEFFDQKWPLLQENKNKNSRFFSESGHFGGINGIFRGTTR